MSVILMRLLLCLCKITVCFVGETSEQETLSFRCFFVIASLVLRSCCGWELSFIKVNVMSAHAPSVHVISCHVVSQMESRNWIARTFRFGAACEWQRHVADLSRNEQETHWQLGSSTTRHVQKKFNLCFVCFFLEVPWFQKTWCNACCQSAFTFCDNDKSNGALKDLPINHQIHIDMILVSF